MFNCFRSLAAGWALVGFSLAGGVLLPQASAVEPMKDTPFVQEYHEAFPIVADGPENDVRAVAVSPEGTVFAATPKGTYRLDGRNWVKQAGAAAGETFDLLTADGAVWIAAWDGVYRIAEGSATKVGDLSHPISVISDSPSGLTAMGPDGAWTYDGSAWTPLSTDWSLNLRDLTTAPDGSLWIATWLGLYHNGPTGVRRYFEPWEITSGAVNGIAFAPNGQLWVGCWGGITVLENGACVRKITTADGLPWWDVRSMAFAPDGTLWAGTAEGVARYSERPDWVAQNNGSPWSLRHSKRWLLDDEVRDIDFDAEGTAWIATAKGVSAIKRRMMTLAEKADYYQAILEERHVRPPGFVEKCKFKRPNDLTEWDGVDDDNDGEYTSLYTTMESIRYAVTGSEEARANATRGFEALSYLHEVTGGKGFFARTVVPSTWTEVHDKNQAFTPEEVAAQRVRDPRWRYVERRWRPSADGKWLWKGDTSSDEVNGHYMGFYYYHKLVADDAQKAKAAKRITTLTDYIIANDYTLVDPETGVYTRWGMWNEDRLRNNDDWWVESFINRFEVLAYLRIAYYMSGDKKYLNEHDRFIKEHGYKEFLRRPKAHRISEQSRIDDSMIYELGPVLYELETDPELKTLLLEGLTWVYSTVADDQSPLFNFSMAQVGGADTRLDESVAFLRDQPLDLRQWIVDNSVREDIDLVRKPMQDSLQTSRMLPPSERGVMRWDKNPWEYISGDFPHEEGLMESSGVFWLLPYWLGRYVGHIEAP
ncbi:MAG: regulator [Candidatus Hydrogenedentes bacterium]|nr:regulator [Candidatus Hydrogenedentota bacterium]